jgi:hypothetical protein
MAVRDMILWLLLIATSNVVSGLDVLLVMVDNRPLSTLSSDDYLKYTVPINYAYAKRHSYDFVVFNFDTSTVISTATARYGTSEAEARRQEGNHLNMGWASPSKQQSAVYHPGLKQFRATPWAKLPILWNITVNGMYNKYYDHIFYMDSDFVINPKYHARSVPDLFHGWTLPDAVTR